MVIPEPSPPAIQGFPSISIQAVKSLPATTCATPVAVTGMPVTAVVVEPQAFNVPSSRRATACWPPAAMPTTRAVKTGGAAIVPATTTKPSARSPRLNFSPAATAIKLVQDASKVIWRAELSPHPRASTRDLCTVRKTGPLRAVPTELATLSSYTPASEGLTTSVVQLAPVNTSTPSRYHL